MASTLAGAVRLELLEYFFAAATHEASAAMCRWTGGLITLSLDEVRELPPEDAAVELNLGDEPVTMIVLRLDDSVGGEMVLVFDEEHGRRLAASLLDRPAATSGAWTALEQSALCETGNILGCAYMNALTRLVELPLVPSTPYFIQDFAASVLEQTLMLRAAKADQVLVCRTVFHCEGESLQWRVFFVPTVALRDALENALARGDLANCVS